MAQRWSHVENDVVYVDEFDETAQNVAFEHWLKLVDRLLLKHIGLTHRDIADRPWRDLHDDNVRPFEVVAEILEEGIDAL